MQTCYELAEQCRVGNEISTHGYASKVLCIFVPTPISTPIQPDVPVHIAPVTHDPSSCNDVIVVIIKYYVAIASI